MNLPGTVNDLDLTNTLVSLSMYKVTRDMHLTDSVCILENVIVA